MATEVASLYATIGAKTEGLKKGLADARSGLKSTAQHFSKMSKIGVGSFTEIVSAINLAGQGLELIKAAWNFSKEGAELVYIDSKFSRLAESIGTTADVLKRDLKAATRGMVSDAELVAGATNFMTLGLAKSHDEAVRLTRVAGALDMNMNQLVLTLTNQTTMRFDQLGVAVDGFDEKVNKLKASGMSANDAFREAFLQQAEEQIAKVGDAADSAIAPFQKLEVAGENFATMLKVKLYPILGNAADGLVDVTEKTSGLNTIMEKTGIPMYQVYLQAILVAAGLQSAETAAAKLSGGMDKLTEIQKDHAAAVRANKVANEQGAIMNEYAAKVQAAAAKEAAKSISNLTDTQARAIGIYQMQSAGIYGMIDRMDEYRASLEETNDNERGNANLLQARIDKLNEMNSIYMQLQGAQQTLAEAQADWGKSVGGDVARALEDSKVKGEDLKTALGLIDEAMGTSLLPQQNYNNRLVELAKSFDPNKPDEFKTALQELAKEFEILSTPIQDAQKRVNDLERDLNALAGRRFTAYVDVMMSVYQATGTGSGGGFRPDEKYGGKGRQYGGPVMAGQTYLVGERGPELFTAPSAGHIVPNNRLTAGGRGNTFIENYYDRSAAALGQAQIRRMRANDLNASMGG